MKTKLSVVLVLISGLAFGKVSSPSGGSVDLTGLASTNDLAIERERAISVENTKADTGTVAAVSSKVDGLANGTEPFTAMTLDREINVWGDIGLTYTDVVRLNDSVTISNNSVWTGWTTTGDLLTNGIIFLTYGEYLQSPVQSNGIASYEYASWSAGNGTSSDPTLMVGTNVVSVPYTGTNGVLRITGGTTMAGQTAGVYISNVVITGYGNVEEAATVKTVSGLRVSGQPSNPNDVVPKRVSDAGIQSAKNYADAEIADYSADPSKTIVGDRLDLGNYTVVGSGAWRGINFTQTADTATIGTRFDDDIITLESGLTVVELIEFTQINTNVSMSIYAQNIIGNPTIGVTTNLMVAFAPIAATITDLGGGYYNAVVDVSGLGSSTGFFRAYGTRAPASAGSVKINAEFLNLDGHTITNVSTIVFTNGWRIACTTNGLGFVAP